MHVGSTIWLDEFHTQCCKVVSHFLLNVLQKLHSLRSSIVEHVQVTLSTLRTEQQLWPHAEQTADSHQS